MKRTFKISALLLFLSFSGGVLGGISSFEALFAPSKLIWLKWTEYDAFSDAHISHDAWNAILGRYLVRDGQGLTRFSYKMVSVEDRRLLDRYLDGLESLPIRRYNKAEQLAYWINFYNALTVQVVLRHYPVHSILDIDISPGLFGRGPWDKKLVTVEGERLSLNDMEHRILRPIWDDPRLHYAVNCAALGCPNLQPRAFKAARIEEMLEKAAREFVNSPRAVWEVEGGIAVSSIYAWFQEDFGGNDEGILRHLRRYADEALAARLEGISEISDHDYDWALNEAAGSQGS